MIIANIACFYWLSLFFKTEVYKWPQFQTSYLRLGTNGSICCCYARNV